MTTVGVRSALFLAPITLGVDRQFRGYVGSLEFTFDVIEYLKGSGGAQVKGMAYGYPRGGSHRVAADTREEAAELARQLLDARDKRWDDREAIVFLRKAPNYGEEHLSQDLDHYWLGELSVFAGSDRQVTVASGEGKAWLPDASASATSTPGTRSAAGSTTKQRFLLEDPGDGAVGNSARTDGAAASIGLSDLRAKIAASDDPEAYGECLAATHEWNREPLNKAPGIYPLRESFESGLAAGETVYTYVEAVEQNLSNYGPTEPATGAGETWFEGRDAHLFSYSYPGYVQVKRPLPAGEYTMVPLWRSQEMVICDGQPDSLRDEYVHAFAVTAPEGTLAESFFDPVADGATVTATVGTMKWEAGEVEATLTQDVTGHVLDFIALDGTVSLSLEAANATSTSGTLSWPVASQPWQGGDELMLRIRRAAPPELTSATSMPPAAPRNLMATSTPTSVTLEWRAPDDPTVTGYQVLRRIQSQGGFQVVAEDMGDAATTYVDTSGIEPGTVYIYRVKAINAAGAGPPSKPARIRTRPEP